MWKRRSLWKKRKWLREGFVAFALKPNNEVWMKVATECENQGKNKKNKWQMQVLKLWALCPVHIGSQCTMHSAMIFSCNIYYLHLPQAMIIIIISSVLRLCLCPLHILSLSPSNLIRAIPIRAKPSQAKPLNESHLANVLYTHFNSSLVKCA